MERAYYYLIASLPELRLDDYKEPYRVHDFVDDLEGNLSPGHMRSVRDLLALQDGMYMVDALLGLEQPWHLRPANYTFADLRHWLQDISGSLPEPMTALAERLREFKRGQETFIRRELEAVVLDWYYCRLMRHENRFISKYVTFEYALRSAVARAQATVFSSARGADLVPPEDVPRPQPTVRTPYDWSCGDDEALISAAVQDMLSTSDLVHAEKQLDTRRWQKVDEIISFNYFDIDVLLGYLTKLTLVERWIRLDPARGREVFTRRTQVSSPELSP